MSPKELIQLATVLDAQAAPRLNQHKPDSPLIAHALAILDELPGVLESALEEAELLEQMAAESQRHQALINRRFRLGL